jgi:anti-sigma B factor antagonist
MPDIQVDVKYAGNDNDIAIISAKGFIDTTTAPDLEKKLEEQLALNKYKIIVDLKNIDYVSSAGWGVFVSEIREIRENNGDLVLINMSSDVYDVYELMEFSSILKSFDNVEDAIVNFTGAAVSRPATEPTRPAQPQITASRSSPAKPVAPKVEPKVEPKPGPQAQPAQPEEDVYALATTELGKRILNVIVDNPYFEVKEIIKALRLPQYGGAKASGGAVKRALRGMDLLDRQKRFELALKRKK